MVSTLEYVSLHFIAASIGLIFYLMTFLRYDRNSTYTAQTRPYKIMRPETKVYCTVQTAIRNIVGNIAVMTMYILKNQSLRESIISFPFK